jgi:GNAT superfamily N-acetyltransferase
MILSSTNNQQPATNQSVRQLTDQDFEAFRELVTAFLAYAKNDPLDFEEVQSLFGKAIGVESNFIVFMASCEGRPVGLLSLTFGESSYKALPFAFADDLFVLESYRGTGIGRGLLSAAVEYARAQGCSNILAGVGMNEERSIRFFRSHGFLDLECRLLSLPL